MKVIYKYPLTLIDSSCVTCTLPVGAAILDVNIQPQGLVLWAVVDTTQPTHVRRFHLFGTGFEVPAELKLIHLKTLMHDKLVYHIFEEVTP